MRTQGIFYSGSGTVYDCELDRCPKCNGLMRVAYTSKYKTVQSMSELAMIAQQTECCVNPGCEASRLYLNPGDLFGFRPSKCRNYNLNLR